MKIPRRLNDIEDSVTKQIREAIERGEFDDLPGKGKPLDLGDNAHVPAEWQLAFKMLRDANVAPRWIEQDKEIRLELQKLGRFLERHAKWQQQQRANLKSLSIDKIPAEHSQLEEARARAITEYRRRASALNKIIDTFNLQAPTARLQHPRIAIEEEIDEFKEKISRRF